MFTINGVECFRVGKFLGLELLLVKPLHNPIAIGFGYTRSRDGPMQTVVLRPSIWSTTREKPLTTGPVTIRYTTQLQSGLVNIPDKWADRCNPLRASAEIAFDMADRYTHRPIIEYPCIAAGAYRPFYVANSHH